MPISVDPQAVLDAKGTGALLLVLKVSPTTLLPAASRHIIFSHADAGE